MTGLQITSLCQLDMAWYLANYQSLFQSCLYCFLENDIIGLSLLVLKASGYSFRDSNSVVFIFASLISRRQVLKNFRILSFTE